jgi:hypothetical protein
VIFGGKFKVTLSACKRSVAIAESGIFVDSRFAVSEPRLTRAQEKVREKRSAFNATRMLRLEKCKKVFRHGGRKNNTGIRYE